ncbi:MAG: hypothetical protein UY31_C0073G0001 [Candidatus Wolfebacteria bacterium GW2011_GWE1_48_7]|uniref:Uncharacterized protein n=1 Tax=Candidatus Wolfebacteria bacterium GW2011_GWA2_47_9b TaxID=1619005 RepID=A0A0G1U5Z0_9BACT|nr:MAG: hypothetical protein UX49_C0034G0001 [Candidatus Wolfebacteria bacterium GW2011_GWC2_46_275]KKU42499.1 MAG: hypothetical protein UX58_C0002G0213 [Candidatus Wolfebacteria bacterium GW2011_GWB2_46_69]KKU54284.1 MAG: hypothetical protein UX76_C0004G0088 [Candidatus Wolfebacteria bacterium GW2011_GWC1_47_103]KKU59652.1 MAG: hypothetical protein UX83_C0003G0067 [Candidatus Wolfebacteria bacterium GW2011_GWE2_47_12]KKU66296.1 MAG: hypothetical protein UX90_C0001G0355 [Candidatus Wolfebacteri
MGCMPIQYHKNAMSCFILTIAFIGISAKINEVLASRPLPPPQCSFCHYDKVAHPGDMRHFGHNPL